MIRMSVNRILPLLLLLVFFTSCTRKYKVEGSSSVTSLDGKMLFLKTLQNGQWVAVDSASYSWTFLNERSCRLCDDGNSLYGR